MKLISHRPPSVTKTIYDNALESYFPGPTFASMFLTPIHLFQLLISCLN